MPAELLAVTLRKPAAPQRALNVTLFVEGTDVARPARVHVPDASLVQQRSPWLRLPTPSFVTDAPAIRAVHPRAAEVQLPLVLSATGQRERTAPYIETVQVGVASDDAAFALTVNVSVSLSVQVRSRVIGSTCYLPLL